MACGPKVACRLKRLDPSANITVLERGRDISNGACGMPYFISGMVDRIEALSETPVGVLREVGFFQKVKGFEILCQREVAAIDRSEKTVRIRDTEAGTESTLPYDVVHIPLGTLRSKWDSIPRDREVLAFCKVSLRGYEAQRILDEKGFPNVSFIEGGLVGWPFELRSGA